MLILSQMEVSAYLHRFADQNIPRKQQAIIKSFAKALEIIPRQLCDNAGFDATNILTRLRVEHRKGNTWAGVDFDNEGVRDNLEAFVWEPSLVKVNAIQAAVEASCLILSVDETISTLAPCYHFLHSTSRLLLTYESDRERAFRTASATTAWLASRCGSTGDKGQRERDAEEMTNY